MEEKLTDKNIGFLYKAMVERDPSKRRVKPVEKNLQLLDFGDLEDSSDDSDFKIGEHENDDSGDDSGESIKDNSDDDEDEDDSGDDKEVEKPKKKDPLKNIVKKEPKIELQDIMTCAGSNLAKNSSIKVDENDVKLPKLSVGDLIDRAIHRQNQVKQRISTDSQNKHLKVLICCVCLGDVSEGNDEIVECDCCGITVHEAGCYGISDTDTAVSNASSSSTEPWFCDACKAGNMSPICELCPNPGGIFKETDVGRWVHLVCALYISGVAFGDVDKLSPVTLFEMPYSRWGAKACTLCEDDRFCRTGVCISCDAGMCRTYFHVTCAQREGLLSEASTEEIADPFFAYCKVHAEKGIIRNKRRNWLALQSQTKENRLESMPPSEEKSRIERKLAWHREKYNAAQASKPPPWESIVPTQKMPRLLTSSATAYRRLARKSELLGLNTQTYLSSTDTMIDIRKKWHIPVAFSVEFVGYYLDRNSRMTSMQKRLDELLQQNSQLQEQEQTLRTRYEKLFSELEGLQGIGKPLMDIGTKLHSILCDIGNKKLPLPEVLQKKQPPKSPSSKNSRRSDHSTSVISECGICHRSNDQHFLAKCDKCTLHYHLQCLDPPLTRMPKKTKSQGWQCSECDKTEEDDKDDRVDPNAPRRLRDHSRENKRGRNSSPVSDCSKVSTRQSRSSRKTMESLSTVNTSSEVDDTGDSQVEDEKDDKNSREKITLTIKKAKRKMAAKDTMAVQRRRGNARKRKLRETVADEKEVKGKVEKEKEKEKEKESTTPPAPKSSRTLLPRKTRSDTKSNCCRCGESGEASNLVKCDECKKCYHLHCLRPPVKKSPKQRGYTWHCEDCDSSVQDITVKKGKSNYKSSTDVTSTKDEDKSFKN